MAEKAVGFIETFGLTAAITAADAACKSANVKLLGYEYAKGDGMCTVKVEGDTAACKAAIMAGKRAAEMVAGTHQGTKSVLLKSRPADEIIPKMIVHRENVGGDIALAEGYRPKGESRMPVLVSHWKPKEEPKEEETPIEEAPEPPVVEDLKDESSEIAKEPEVVEETPVEETPVPEEPAPEPAKETPAEEVKAETVTEEISEVVEAPKAEEAATVEAPAEEAPVEEVPAEEAEAAPETPAEEVPEAPAEETPAPAEPEKEEKEETPETAEAEKAKEAPKKKTTGTRRGGRKKKKSPDKE